MPTARELLEQVDRLMRRNREEAAWAEIPVLTEVVEPEVASPPRPVDGGNSGAIDVPGGGDGSDATAVSIDGGSSETNAMPVDGDNPDTAVMPVDRDSSDTNAMPVNCDSSDTTVLSVAPIDGPADRVDEASGLSSPATAEALLTEPGMPAGDETRVDGDAVQRSDVAAGGEPVPLQPTNTQVTAIDAAATTNGQGAGFDPRSDPEWWEMLAEDVRIQVMHRIDIFTDSGLQDQLRARLQPIVDEASAQLVTAIGQHVGQLMRSYVAEAIEREIDKWRQDSG